MTEITGTTDLLGLIGNPVRGSLSPELHNYIIHRLGLDCRYLCFNVERESLGSAVKGAAALGVKGLNVTVPHKIAVMEMMDDLSDSARRLSAVNTITFSQDRGIIGDNTDWIGFVESLKLNGFDPRQMDCVVFGAGGAARAVVYGLIRSQASSIVLVNRTSGKARKLAERMNGFSGDTCIDYLRLDCEDVANEVRRADLLVNATPVGTGNLEGESVWDRPDLFTPDQFVFDLIYKPSPTRFLQLAANQGAMTAGGLDMLILQGIESFKKWTGESFGSAEMLGELKTHLE